MTGRAKFLMCFLFTLQVAIACYLLWFLPRAIADTFFQESINEFIAKENSLFFQTSKWVLLAGLILIGGVKLRSILLGKDAKMNAIFGKK